MKKSTSLTDLSGVKKQFHENLHVAYSNVQQLREGHMSKLKSEIEHCNSHIMQSFEEKFALSTRLGQDCLTKVDSISQLRRLLDSMEKKAQLFVAFEDLNKFVTQVDSELQKEVFI